MKSLLRDVEEQVQRWQMRHAEPKKEAHRVSVITVSREPGSGGKVVAQRLAEELGMDYFHQEMVHKIAESARVSTLVVKTLDEKSLNVLDDWVSSHVNENHLWPDEYLKHLLKVIGTIGRHGQAVVVGRGGNFILHGPLVFRLRIVAPLELRIKNVIDQYGGDSTLVSRRVLQTDSDRKAFIRKYFHKDISDPLNYDLLINTGQVSIDGAVRTIRTAIDCFHKAD
jgi:cytidylate kinase